MFTHDTAHSTTTSNMENLDLKQSIPWRVSYSSRPGDEGRMATGPPDPSTTLRWHKGGQGRESSMVDDVINRDQPPSRLDGAVMPDESASLLSSSTHPVSTINACHLPAGLLSLAEGEVGGRGTATPSERQYYELTGARATSDDVRSTGSTSMPSEVDRRRPDAVNSNSLELSSSNLRGGIVNNQTGDQLPSTAISDVGAYQGVTPGLYRHQYRTAPATTAALAATVAISTVLVLVLEG